VIVIILEKVPVGLRGELTRWLLELKTGVFVGRESAMVRDKLWEDICTRSRGGAAVLIYGADNEQGFAVRMWGPTSRAVVDFDGLSLVRVS
jgi:CRISPR-associated protein Cas2